MNSLKAAFWPVFFSLTLHAAGLALTASPWMTPEETASDPIEILYVQQDKKVSAPETVITPVKKKVKGIPVPRYTPEEMVKKESPVSDFQRMMEEKIRKQELQLARLAAEERESPEKAKPRSSAEILADPQKGKIFVSYFGEVKQKIQQTLHDRFSYRFSTKGSVHLIFVLASDGALEQVSVSEKDGTPDPALKELAVQCLKDSAPFGVFPANLGPQKIAFNLTIFFDGR